MLDGFKSQLQRWLFYFIPQVVHLRNDSSQTKLARFFVAVNRSLCVEITRLWAAQKVLKKSIWRSGFLLANI